MAHGSGDVVGTATSDRLSTDDPAATGRLAGDGAGSVPAFVTYAAAYYDAAGRLAAAADFGTAAPTAAQRSAVPAGTAALLVTAYAYDAAGNVAAVTDPRGLVTAYGYDALGRTTRTVADYTGDGTPTDATNQTTTWAYDGDGNVTAMTAVMPSGTPSQTTQYVYGVVTAGGLHDNDLLAQTRYPDPSTGTVMGPTYVQFETYGYDNLGERTSYTDRNGTTHAYAYDALGRLSSDTVTAFGTGVDQAVKSLGYTYTDAGQLATATSYDANGAVVNQTQDTYDGFGQLASEAQAVTGKVTTGTPTVGYTYDPTRGDRQTGITYPNGRTVNYTYAAGTDDAVSRVSAITDGSGTIRSYAYQGLGTVMSATDGNGVTRTVTLDGLGRVSTLAYAKGGTTLDGQQYTYDADGNVTSRLNLAIATQSEAYTYDGLNRLTSFGRGTLGSNGSISGTSRSQSWAYDATGNWRSVTSDGSTTARTNDAQNRATAVGSATLGYDRNGNTLADDQGQQYVYDAWNRLVAAKSPAGATVASYTYDAQGRRATETHGTTTTALYYDDHWQVVEERVNGTPTAQYVWDGTDRLVARDDHDPATSGAALNRRLYAQQDADGNVTSLTDASGAVVERYRYDPYGAVTVLNPDGSVRGDGTAASSVYGWVYLHQGLRLDVATGTYDSRNRVYIVSLGRFAQQDPTEYLDGVNRYQTDESNPPDFNDPTGLKPVTMSYYDHLGQRDPYYADWDTDNGTFLSHGSDASGNLGDWYLDKETNTRVFVPDVPPRKIPAVEGDVNPEDLLTDQQKKDRELAKVPVNLAKDKADAMADNNVNCRQWALDTNGQPPQGKYPQPLKKGDPDPLASDDNLRDYTDKEVSERGGRSVSRNEPTRPGYHKIAVYRRITIYGNDAHYATQDDDGRWSNKETEKSPARHIYFERSNPMVGAITDIVGFWEVPGPPRSLP